MESVASQETPPAFEDTCPEEVDDEPTDMKLALLASLHPKLDTGDLMDVLIAHDGSVTRASDSLQMRVPIRKRPGDTIQQSLKRFALGDMRERKMAKRGSTSYLYDPEDVAQHTPCTIIHNFLPKDQADDLLKELLAESQSFEKITFKLFENVVSSPHTSSFYVESYDEVREQQTDYHYNGARLTDVRRITPQLLKVKTKVQIAVNEEIEKRIKTRYPNGRKLRYQSPNPWVPNAAFVNCYNGAKESVGWHSDSLTYLGPRAVIGSLSLGVAREFRVRRVLPRDSSNKALDDTDSEGQLSIHLPHNSLLVMHADMQEEWKHSISPALSIDAHPIGGAKRINVTYRHYRANMHPRLTPRCQCDVPCILRVVQKKQENYGRYFWMCHAGNVPGEKGCSFFQWAEFDDDGNPIWKDSVK